MDLWIAFQYAAGALVTGPLLLILLKALLFGQKPEWMRHAPDERLRRRIRNRETGRIDRQNFRRRFAAASRKFFPFPAVDYVYGHDDHGRVFEYAIDKHGEIVSVIEL